MCELVVAIIQATHPNMIQTNQQATPPVFASLLQAVSAGTLTKEQVGGAVKSVMAELLKALAAERRAEVARDFADSAMRIIKACYESGGEMANGVQPPPAFVYPPALVDSTLNALIAVAKTSIECRQQAQKEAVRCLRACLLAA